MEQIDKSNRNLAIEIVLFLSGISIFACFIGQSRVPVLIALAGLVLAVGMISRRIRTLANLAVVFGFGKLSGVSFYFLLIAILAGLLFGMVYRNSLMIGVLPHRLAGFAILASMIGATEELLFRGYLQTNTRRYGIILSILLGTCAHTAYKFLLFSSFRVGLDITLPGLVVWTLIGGVVFGLLKEYSKSTLFPIIAHAVFDIIVYGDRTIVPWWIWS